MGPDRPRVDFRRVCGLRRRSAECLPGALGPWCPGAFETGRRPSDFLRKYPETFEVLGGGNVRLRQAQAEPGAAPPADARPADPLSPASNAATPPDGPALLSLDDTICSKARRALSAVVGWVGAAGDI